MEEPLPLTSPTGRASGIEALVLAGGAGTRLRAVSGGIPKPLCEVGGQPFLAYVLRQISDAGIGRCIVCTGYRGDHVEKTMGSSFGGSLRLEYSREPEPRGTAGALRHALGKLTADPVLVMNGDSYVRTPLAKFVDWHRTRAFPATLTAVRVADASSSGRLEIDPATHRLKSFAEKREGADSAWANAGVYLLSRSLLLDIPEGRFVSIERDMFPAWVARGQVGAYRIDAEFTDIGTPSRLARARNQMDGAT